MSAILPAGYLSLREAAKVLEQHLFAGEPDRPLVVENRKTLQVDLGDREAQHEATNRIWTAVDSGDLRAMVIGGHPRQILRLPTDLSNSVPLLRHPTVASLAFLRPSSPDFQKFLAWFGRDLPNVTVAFREKEVLKLANKARRHRRKQPGARRVGRPPLAGRVKPAIQKIVHARQWNSSQSLKALTRLVSQVPRIGNVSNDTIRRCLDQLYDETLDRRYARIKRKPGP